MIIIGIGIVIIITIYIPMKNHNITRIGMAMCFLLSMVCGKNLHAQTIISSDNLAINKSVTSSSFQTDKYAINAFDNNLSTRFSSLYNDNEWISVDLGQVYLISRVTLVWERAYGRDFNILFSRDGSFTDRNADSIQIRNNVLGRDMDTLAGTNVINTKSNTIARYVRMQGIKRATVHGYSLYEFQVAGSISNSGVLPATLTGLNASAVNNNTLIEWTTTTEINTAGFSVERSNDGTNFNTIGWVNAVNSGTVVTRYSFTDKQAFTGRNYYRLKVFDVTGKSGSSTAVSINKTSANNFAAYPVPVIDHITLEYKGTAGESLQVSIVNAGGQPVYNNTQTIRGNQQTMVINRTGNMTPGIYFLTVRSSSNSKYTTPLVLQ